MKDRVAGAPGQYSAVVSSIEYEKLQSGQPFNITLMRDDKPEVEGTPYSKAAVLPDDLAESLCPDIEDPTPADALKALNKGKAPAGYGLGEAAKKPAGSFDDVMGGAFIEAGLGAAHANSSWAGINVTFGNEFNHGYQEAVDVLNHPNVKARRTRLNRKWNEWEYENPPMNPGVEYRTTERSEGKPVYAKRISYTPGTTLGKVGASTDTSIAHRIANFNYLVRCSGRHATYSLPELTMTNGTVSINQVGTSAIVLRHINTVTSATTWYFDLYYTKTTD